MNIIKKIIDSIVNDDVFTITRQRRVTKMVPIEPVRAEYPSPTSQETQPIKPSVAPLVSRSDAQKTPSAPPFKLRGVSNEIPLTPEKKAALKNQAARYLYIIRLNGAGRKENHHLVHLFEQACQHGGLTYAEMKTSQAELASARSPQ